MNTSLPQLQIFLTVARLSSFTRAARELGVSTPAVSQSVRQLEEQLRVTLLTRTTRSVALTESGRRLVENAGPAMEQALGALTHVSAEPGELVGKLRLSVPRLAGPYVVTPVLPVFHARHPRVEVEVVFEDRFVDLVADGYDAGVRLAESIERDMVQVRVTDAFRFVVAGSPEYLARRGVPQRPEDLLRHDCISFRTSTGSLYAWELERGRRNWRVPVRGPAITNDGTTAEVLCEAGLGLIYAAEPRVQQRLRSGKLKIVLEPFAATVPGFFLYYPSRAQSSPALKAFVEVAKKHAVRAL
ncbi:MAG: LysR family transcriptional regulator [Myxococcaceae bacterium]